ncbi:complex I intermediate-associated protein 30, mitochondrial-like isoform X2 [Mizuhopecten yessoensis]|nr:complex I intermediate-associated protein 30, mitochondrial-like isoform X2 [Mizuhopecten yessoensis]XP_021379912.1 complex I intermediate-associated protein 30, mitochondrial-like isoform X2 [Mizuhopecten yessoensis]
MSALKVAKSCRPFLRPKYQPLVIQTATSVNLFDVDKKGGYRNDLTDNSRKHIIDTAKSWRGELKKFRNELKDILHLRHLDRWNQGHGTYDYLWKFGGQQSIENWTLTADRDNLEGKSSANLTVSKDNNALFHGYLCQEVPQDGVSKSAGYCNIRSPSNYISFRRKQVIEDIGCYTHLVMRVRGDGRPYFINLMMKRTFDITWADQYNYNLYTRGGPYWQTAKIPFSKFFFSNKGRTQDSQEMLDLHNVENIGITIADSVEGPFKLEIDYIAVLNDANHLEETAYEDYGFTF